ncbi:hypothetical protein QJS10_CPB12g01212 [Acorus calamus]|uniref:Uncharacterized protein n=1 Tax=Acorus calamus TaxID=4465 RepID=A0AAV9DPE2_ACOCL|nr:hypothetical protein QJS10_CPB12g01212 [Acorus calamus]
MFSKYTRCPRKIASLRVHHSAQSPAGMSRLRKRACVFLPPDGAMERIASHRSGKDWNVKLLLVAMLRADHSLVATRHDNTVNLDIHPPKRARPYKVNPRSIF